MTDIAYTRHADINKTECEMLAYKVLSKDMEQSSVIWHIECPFCFAEVKVYLWSLCGGGKRCDCGNLLDSLGKAYKVTSPTSRGKKND